MNKRGIAKLGILFVLIVISVLLVSFIFAESSDEEKARLLAEKAELEQRLLEIDNGKWVNVSVETLIANTTYSELLIDNSTTQDDLVPLELKCGDYELYNKDSLISSNDFWLVLWNGTRIRLIDTINNELPIKSIYVDNYNCTGIGYWTSLSNNNQNLDHQTLSANSIGLKNFNEVGE